MKDRTKGHRSKKQRKPPKSFPIINMNAAGIDIVSGEHYVAVPEDRDEQPVRRFGYVCLLLREAVSPRTCRSQIGCVGS